MEYVRFAGNESLYGEKNLLNVELGILEFVKKIKHYKKLRQEELASKIILKSRIGELLELLNVFDKQLPHSKMIGLIKERKKHMNDKLEGMSEEDKDIYTLDQEVERIRRKLEMLREI